VAGRENVSLLKLDNLAIDIDEIRESDFEIEERMRKAKYLLDNYEDIRVKKIDVTFEKEVWVFEDKIMHSKVNFDFSVIANLLRFVNDNTLIIAIKCWIVDRLNNNYISTAKTSFKNIISAQLATKGLTNTNDIIAKVQELILPDEENPKGKKVLEYQMLDFIADFKDFLEFYNKNKYLELINLLIEQESKIKFKKRNRKLPLFKDVLTIKMYLDKWYEDNLMDKKTLLKYYHLVIWWELCSIIPMRIIEFCQILRNCLSEAEDGDAYSVTFPREKHDRKGQHRVEIEYDTLPIPERLYNLIQDYKKMTENEQFGKSNYLFSYKVYSHYFVKSVRRDIDENTIISPRNFHRTLANFYTEILHNKYKINILSIDDSFIRKERLIIDSPNGSVYSLLKPGDLRHIAIINMMMQGYDKVEIQRLAGHITDDTQYSYFNHIENWMDIEIQKMEKEFINYVPINYDGLERKIPIVHPQVQEFIEKRSKEDYINGNFDNGKQNNYLKLDLGYCKDKSMPCPSFNWKHRGCYFCELWTISFDEIEDKRNILVNDLNILYDETIDKIKFYKNLYKVQMGDLRKANHNNKQDLMSTSNEIRLGIKRISKLRAMLGVKNNE